VNGKSLLGSPAFRRNRLRNFELGFSTWVGLCAIWIRSLPFVKYTNILFP
jgi:hypothetical protein